MQAYGILQRRRAKRGRERTSHVAGTDRAKRYEVTASVTGAFFIIFLTHWVEYRDMCSLCILESCKYT